MFVEVKRKQKTDYYAKKKGLLHMLHVWEQCQQQYNSNAHFPKCPQEKRKSTKTQHFPPGKGQAQ